MNGSGKDTSGPRTAGDLPDAAPPGGGTGSAGTTPRQPEDPTEGAGSQVSPSAGPPAAAAQAAGQAEAGAARQPQRRPAARRSAAESAASAPHPRGHGRRGHVAAPAVSVLTDDELVHFRAQLNAEVDRLRAELVLAEEDMAGLIADSGDGAGDDTADTGSKTFEREHEMSVTANTRELLDQTVRALQRLEAGTYGLCESCGRPITKGRLRAFPRATLCIDCKQREERR